MPRSECRGRVAVTYSLEVCCNQTGDRYAARRYERARFYREVTATRLAGLFTQSRQRWVRDVTAFTGLAGRLKMLKPLNTHVVRDCVKSLNTPTSVGGSLISAYVEAPDLSRVVYSFPITSRGKRYQDKEGPAAST